MRALARLAVAAKAARTSAAAVTLIELIAVAVVLGVFALIVAPNIQNAVGTAKLSALTTTLSVLQDESDAFYAQKGAYPSFPGTTATNQPGSGVWGVAFNKSADPNGLTFLPNFIHNVPVASAASFGLSPSNGATIYWGVNKNGLAFATQVSPSVAAPGELYWGSVPSSYYDVQGDPTGQVQSALVTPTPAAPTILTTLGDSPLDFAGYGIDASGKATAWGLNTYGQVGNGTENNQPTPVALSGISGTVTEMAGGYKTGYALTGGGQVYGWGQDYYSLGDGQDVASQESPVLLPRLPANVVSISAGNSTGYAIDGSGNLWDWGSGTYGELCTGTVGSAYIEPVQQTTITGLKQVAEGDWTTYLLKSSGTVWACGLNKESSNTFGMLGTGSASMQDSGTPLQVQGLSNVTQIAAGTWTGFALESNGTVWGWGSGTAGQLGATYFNTSTPTAVQIPGLSNIVAIAAGSGTLYALDKNGVVWAIGSGEGGELGSGATGSSTTPQQVQGLSSVVAIGASDMNGYAQEANGNVYAWGTDSQGSSGSGQVNTTLWTPVQINLP